MRKEQMIISFVKYLKTLLSNEETADQAYDGYTPSKVRTFDEAIEHAPVRQEWLDDATLWQHAKHVASKMTTREWVEGAAFVLSVIVVLYIVLSVN